MVLFSLLTMFGIYQPLSAFFFSSLSIFSILFVSVFLLLFNSLLNFFSSLFFFLSSSLLSVGGVKEHLIECVTNSSSRTGDHRVTVRYGNIDRHLNDTMYLYTPNPNITQAAPSKSFLRCVCKSERKINVVSFYLLSFDETLCAHIAVMQVVLKSYCSCTILLGMLLCTVSCCLEGLLVSVGVPHFLSACA